MYNVYYFPKKKQKPNIFVLRVYEPMVLILDDNSEIGAQVMSNLCYLICLRHFIRSDIFSPKRLILYVCEAAKK